MEGGRGARKGPRITILQKRSITVLSPLLVVAAGLFLGAVTVLLLLLFLFLVLLLLLLLVLLLLFLLCFVLF